MPILLGLMLMGLLEIAGFVWIGPILGVGGTLGFVLLSALAGMALLRHEGVGTLVRVQRELRTGGAPVPAALDGACRILASLLLIVPGFFSTAAGLLLLLPPVRGFVIAWLVAKGTAIGIQGGAPGLWSMRFGTARTTTTTVIDGEYREVRPADQALPPRPDSDRP